MSNDIVEVPFNGSAMIAQRFDDGEIYTALKPICENIGIAYNGQWERLNRTPWATIRMIRTVGADGKHRDMVAISRKTLTMWLATIDTNRLSDEQARHNVTVYQQEAAEALDKYFNEGGAIRVSDADSDEDIMARAVLVAQKTIERKNQQLQAKDEQIKELEPKAKALDDFTNVPDALLVRDAAKLLSNSGTRIGEHELRQWLVDNGWIYRQPKPVMVRGVKSCEARPYGHGVLPFPRNPQGWHAIRLSADPEADAQGIGAYPPAVVRTKFRASA